MLFASFLAAAFGITAPNTSLATTPTGYFGGNAAHRDNASIAMLAKNRVIMIEKWEGHCWQDCLAGGVGSPACEASCDVEALIMDTISRAKAINPELCGVLYLNTLLAFPFYALNGKMKTANALTIDAKTKKPIVIRNDNGMEGIYVFGFDTPQGKQIYIEAVKNLTKGGIVDGLFGDKWNSQAKPSKNDTKLWEICNHECGYVTPEQGALWNKGKAEVLQAVEKILGDGPYYANGDVFTGDPSIAKGVPSNFFGSWANENMLRHGDPRKLVSTVQTWLHGDSTRPPHKWVYIASDGDQHWTVDPNDPASQIGKCIGDCHARFLLAVEEGVFLGTNGYVDDYDRSLGDPKGPAVFNAGSGNAMPTLTREFGDKGTKVVFTYDSAKAIDGKGVIFWNGVAPTPTPPPTKPPPPAGKTITCGAKQSVEYTSSTYALNDVLVAKDIADAQTCCTTCSTVKDATKWAWHTKAQGNYGANACHCHGASAVMKAASGDTAGVYK